jgi:putative oxidoreductase
MNMNNKYNEYGPTVLRVFLGLLFFIPGLNKFANPGMIAGMLGGMGMPAPSFLAWIVTIVEVVGGGALILGYKTDLVVWPLAIVLLVATFAVHIPALGSSPMATVNLLWHFVGISGLISLYLTGPGAKTIVEKS